MSRDVADAAVVLRREIDKKFPLGAIVVAEDGGGSDEFGQGTIVCDEIGCCGYDEVRIRITAGGGGALEFNRRWDKIERLETTLSTDPLGIDVATFLGTSVAHFPAGTTPAEGQAALEFALRHGLELLRLQAIANITDLPPEGRLAAQAVLRNLPDEEPKLCQRA